MGGNAKFTNYKTKETGYADKINLLMFSRQDLIKNIKALLKKINNLAFTETNEYIWNDFSVISSSKAFNGSSKYFMSPKISDTDYIKHKQLTGDIDLTIPKEKIFVIFDLLRNNEDNVFLNSKNYKIIYKGQKREFYNKNDHKEMQLNCIFKYIEKSSGNSINIQIDFEPSDYEDDKPTEFASFGHSSHWSDISSGIKSVFHKYLLRALIKEGYVLDDVLIATDKSTPEKIRISTSGGKPLSAYLYTFSVDKGLRIKIKPFLDDNGNQIIYDNKRVYKNISVSDSNYKKDLNDIYFILFNKKGTKQNLEKMWSFVGLIDLIKIYFNEKSIQKIFKRFLILCWGTKDYGLEAGQQLERDNPELDYGIKASAKDYFIKNFPFLKPDYTEFESVIKDFYKNYKMMNDPENNENYFKTNKDYEIKEKLDIIRGLNLKGMYSDKYNSEKFNSKTKSKKRIDEYSITERLNILSE